MEMKKKTGSVLGSAVLAVLLLLALTACSSNSPSLADYESLAKRVEQLEQQLAGQQQELDKLKAVKTGMASSEAGGTTSEPENNGPANQGDGVLITFAQYEQLNIGMTYEEVVEIIGGDGNAISESDDMVVYSYFGTGTTGANAVLTFQNGKLLNKAQAGLE